MAENRTHNQGCHPFDYGFSTPSPSMMMSSLRLFDENRTYIVDVDVIQFLRPPGLHPPNQPRWRLILKYVETSKGYTSDISLETTRRFPAYVLANKDSCTSYIALSTVESSDIDPQPD